MATTKNAVLVWEELTFGGGSVLGGSLVDGEKTPLPLPSPNHSPVKKTLISTLVSDFF